MSTNCGCDGSIQIPSQSDKDKIIDALGSPHSGKCGPTYNQLYAKDIPYISFNNILNLAIIDLASIGVDGIMELLTINEHIDGMDVIMNIMKHTIDENERANPQEVDLYPYYQMYTPYTFVDNFWEYINDNKIDRRNLQLIPRVIISIIGTYLGTLRNVDYDPPTVRNITYQGQFRTHCLVNRPFRMEKDGFAFSDDSRYYFMGETYNKEVLERFRMLFTLKLSKYIIRLNENADHPNLPISTFQGLQNYASDLESNYKELLDASFSYYGIYDIQ